VKRACRAGRDIDDATTDERAAIVDPATNGITAGGDGDECSERPRPVRASDLVAPSRSTVVGGKAAFGVKGIGIGDHKQEDRQQEIGVAHVKTLPQAAELRDKFREPQWFLLGERGRCNAQLAREIHPLQSNATGDRGGDSAPHREKVWNWVATPHLSWCNAAVREG
jgi:hypothetical protein